MVNNIKSSLIDAQTYLNDLIANEAALSDIEKAATIICKSLGNNSRIFSCGNGGSMCDATHFAEELTGRFRKNRKAYSAIAINDPSHISCVANDFGYDFVFSRYLEANGKKGDTLLAISTSGSSPTIINAAKIAQSLDIKVVALTGKVNDELKSFSDVYICTPCGDTSDRVQELHIKILHIIIEMIERSFHPELY